MALWPQGGGRLRNALPKPCPGSFWQDYGQDFVVLFPPARLSVFPQDVSAVPQMRSPLLGSPLKISSHRGVFHRRAVPRLEMALWLQVIPDSVSAAELGMGARNKHVRPRGTADTGTVPSCGAPSARHRLPRTGLRCRGWRPWQRWPVLPGFLWPQL